MDYLNGMQEKVSGKETLSDFWENLPEKINVATIQRISKKVNKMNRGYKLYQEKNSFLSLIAQLKNLVKNKEDEIERI